MHPFSLSFPSHSASHSHNGPHGGATGGNRRILRRYDLLSIHAVSLCSPHGGGGCCRTKNTSSTWSLQRSWCLDTATQKNGSRRTVWLGLPLSGKPPPFSTLIYLRCRWQRISPSSCSLPPVLLTQRDETFYKVGRGPVINLGAAGTGGGKGFMILCFWLENQEVQIHT